MDAGSRSGWEQADESGAILSRSRQVLRRQAEDAGCEDGLSSDSVPPADTPKNPSVQTRRAKALPQNCKAFAQMASLEGLCLCLAPPPRDSEARRLRSGGLRLARSQRPGLPAGRCPVRHRPFGYKIICWAQKTGGRYLVDSQKDTEFKVQNFALWIHVFIDL